MFRDRSSHNLESYKQTITSFPIRSVLGFLIEDDHVLLGWKKTGIGQGYLVGIGGKVEGREGSVAALNREFEQETRAQILEIGHGGSLDCFFQSRRLSKFNQRIVINIGKAHIGNIVETAEIRPEWFPLDHVPYEQMWPGSEEYLSLLFNNISFHANILYKQDRNGLKVKEFNLRRGYCLNHYHDVDAEFAERFF